jgi:hypothetical protein
MMYKYVLTYQPNLISLYSLGRLHAPCQPLPPEKAVDHHLRAYRGGYWGPTDRDLTSQRPPYGASSSLPYLAPDSHQKAAHGSPQKVAPDAPHKPAPDSPHKQALGSPQALGPISLPVSASVSTP